MGLEERVYSVLVATAAESFRTALTELLPEASYSPVCFVSDAGAARRAAAERDFDFVIINSPLPDDLGVRFAIDLCASKSAVVLLLVRAELHDGTYVKVAPHGVFTLPKPTARQSLLRALAWMASARERLRRYEKNTLTIEENIILAMSLHGKKKKEIDARTDEILKTLGISEIRNKFPGQVSGGQK